MPADASSPQQANNLPARVRPQVRYWIPEGYVTAEGLRADIRALARRGFGAIELVAVNFFNTPMPDEARWGTPRYYEAVRVVLREAHELGLAVDIANGPGWPISVPHISDANDPATLFELTYGVTHVQLPAHDTLALPERRVTHEEGSPQLVSACAYRLVGDKILDEHSYVNLLPFAHGNEIKGWSDSSSDTSAIWAIFAFYAQPACHKVLNQHFVID
ncbi:MAG: glycosyl hydrolase, partial [Coriobacteriales bacterium]|nr:glycosyl hydrolase [Coriobacteriales bacterium]